MCYNNVSLIRGDSMSSIIRVKEVEIRNLKNVKKGAFNINVNFDNMDKADVIGLYGQNGSGKTAIVDAFQLLKTLLSPKNRELPNLDQHLIYYNEEAIQLTFTFIKKNIDGEFFIKYRVTLKASESNDKDDQVLKVYQEELSYRENIKHKRYKSLIKKDNDDISIRNHHVDSMSETGKVSVLVANKMSKGNSTSFVFREELKESLELYLSKVERNIINCLLHEFNKDFHVINTTHYGLLIANIMMPFSVHIDNKRGHIPYDLEDTMVFPEEVYEVMKKVIEQTNIVLKNIVPGLEVKINMISKEKMDGGIQGIRLELLSVKNQIELPLRCESEGILKIISILTTLIAVYNNPNACVVIDELDSGIFEYLLGEILEVLSESGKGQLFFTSHNLRILEVLPINNLWFTTANAEDRYIQLKGVKKLNNARDVYLRAIQLGGQKEQIYEETDSYDIKRSFRKAGISNE